MTALNNRALLISLPTLTRVFDTNLATIQWALLAYDLAILGLVLTLGRLGDLYGRKRIYVAGFLLFACSSVLCGLSQSSAQLITFRVLQGIGGAMLTANGRAIISVVFGAKERGKAMGLTSMAYHVGFLSGPTLGGFLIDTVGWRWIFYLNSPVGLAGAYMAWKILEQTEEDKEPGRIDVLGACLLLMGNTSLLFAMNQLPRLGPVHPRFLLIALFSTVVFVCFIATEVRAQTPILSLSLFRSRLFCFGNLSLFLITATQSAFNFLMPFYLQNLMGYTPSQMGWIIIINSVVIIIIAPVAGWWSDRLGSRFLCTVGAGFMALAMFFLAFLNLDSTVLGILWPLAMLGFGWALFNAPNTAAVLGAVAQDKVGAASGMMVTTTRIGGTLGVALSAALFTYGLSTAGMARNQVESPENWGSSPELFIQTFAATVHSINSFILLAIVFSAMRGGRRE